MYKICVDLWKANCSGSSIISKRRTCQLYHQSSHWTSRSRIIPLFCTGNMAAKVANWPQVILSISKLHYRILMRKKSTNTKSKIQTFSKQSTSANSTYSMSRKQPHKKITMWPRNLFSTQMESGKIYKLDQLLGRFQA